MRLQSAILVGAVTGALSLAPQIASASSSGTAVPASKWTIQGTTAVSLPSDSTLNDVFCKVTCVAVGDSQGTASFGYADLWNGTKWTPQSVSQPIGAVGSELSAVSCSSASACTTVGGYLTLSGEVNLAERWNGSVWVPQSIPTPGDPTLPFLPRELASVSCPTATDCTTVGNYTVPSTGVDVTLAEQWKGSEWTVEATPNPAAADRYSQLTGVSCSDPVACTAVGVYYDSSNLEHMLVEAWNGETWSIQTAPNPVGFAQTWLNGVSCTSTSSCTAVGAESSTSQTLALAEHWNGLTWSIQPTPSGLAGVLTAVSCTTSQACTAVGMYRL